MGAKRTLIWGAGAIGGTVGAALVKAGSPVTFVEASDEHRSVMKSSGIRIFGPVCEYSVNAQVYSPDEIIGQFDRIFLCVKCQHTGMILPRLSDHLAKDGDVVILQNGLTYESVVREQGPRRVIIGLVAIYADYFGPGEIHYGGRGTVALGRPDQSIDERLIETTECLRRFDPSVFSTPNIVGFIWAKVVFLVLLFAAAVTMEPITAVLENSRNRRYLKRLAGEVMNVAAAEGVRAEPFDGFDPNVFLPGVDDPAVDAMFVSMLVNCRRSAKTHSGIWRDLAVRRRATEVDEILGPVVAKGGPYGVACPFLARLIDVIHDIETGKTEQSLELLMMLVREEALG